MPALPYTLTEHAERDFFEALKRSDRYFGQDAAVRYQHLLVTAFEAISEDPDLMFSRPIGNLNLYHIRHCRKDAAVNGVIVKKPRHFVVYREKDGSVEILRILHDERQIEEHLRKL